MRPSWGPEESGRQVAGCRLRKLSIPFSLNRSLNVNMVAAEMDLGELLAHWTYVPPQVDSGTAPFFELLPTNVIDNLRMREVLIEGGLRSAHDAETLRYMCEADPLFWINGFVWTYDPRLADSGEEPTVPFITYPFQNPNFLEIHRSIGRNDLVIEKSRDMGASWLILLAFLHRFLFRYDETFLLISRVKDLVDKRGDPDALFWKLDFVLEHLPAWMLPDTTRTSMHLVNLRTGSTIDGTSTTGDAARGGRRTAMMIDEFAAIEDGHALLSATRDVTNSRIMNSTPKGRGNAHYDVAHKADIPKLRFHWTMHPGKAKGLYIDPETGKPRSPWYDNECKRAAHPQEIAQELDIDYLGSDFAYFDPMLLTRYQAQFVAEPALQGDLDYEADTARPVEFIPMTRGHLRLWRELDPRTMAPLESGEYVIGVDIATGTGSSNSAIIVFERGTNEQVAEYANPHIHPPQLAMVAVAMARWFKGSSARGAMLIWEDNGPGVEFRNRVLELGYRHIYYRQHLRILTKQHSMSPGWYSTGESKRELMGNLRRAIMDSRIVIRSHEVITECRELVYTTGGSIDNVHAAAKGLDPTGARDNHADRAVAAALGAWLLLSDREDDKAEEETPDPVPRSIHARRVAQRREKSRDEWEGWEP